MHKAVVAMMALGLSACVAAPPPVVGNPKATSASLKASQAAASASAVRPGDADMSCDAIQAELAQFMNDPEYRATIASMGARASDQKASIDSAMAKHSSKSSADPAALAQGTAADLEKIMPQIMRSQRLSTLAQGKNCAFMADAHKH
jgi:hypothetical protein